MLELVSELRREEASFLVMIAIYRSQNASRERRVHNGKETNWGTDDDGATETDVAKEGRWEGKAGPTTMRDATEGRTRHRCGVVQVILAKKGGWEGARIARFVRSVNWTEGVVKRMVEELILEGAVGCSGGSMMSRKGDGRKERLTIRCKESTDSD